MPTSKDVPKAIKAEAEIIESTLTMRTFTLSVEEILPVIINLKPTIEEYDKIQDPLGKDKGVTDWTLANIKGINEFVCKQNISFEEVRLVRDDKESI